ncbi:hypothetical protein ZWY2020_054261 [Hordeum vulgare]|nr:hypothetical protein ZWY2020_054261 [Hordeum vulgare]
MRDSWCSVHRRKHGRLVRRATSPDDGRWFMDVFHATDAWMQGRRRRQAFVPPKSRRRQAPRRRIAAAKEALAAELIGADRRLPLRCSSGCTTAPQTVDAKARRMAAAGRPVFV